MEFLVGLQIRAATDYDMLTCAGLESVISEVKRGNKDDSKNIEAALKELCSELARRAEGGLKVSVAPLIFWRSFDSALRKSCTEIWRNLEIEFPQLEFLPELSHLRLADDGVHLHDNSANKYIEHIMAKSMAIWLREDTEMEQDNSDSQSLDRTIIGNSTPARTGQSFRAAGDAAGLSQLRGEFRAFKRSVENRFDRDLIVFARHEESLDTVKNEKALDRIVFSGINIDKLEGKPADKVEPMRAAINLVVASILNLSEEDIENGALPKIVFIAHLNPQVRSTYRVVEARFESRQVAAKIREAFGKKYKEMKTSGIFPDVLKGVGVNLSVTRETKVRIEVLKALAKIVNENTTADCTAFVLQYMPRPMLKILIREGETRTFARTFGYTEAIEHVKAAYPINDQDLFQAYSKAGNMKNLEHKFVLLKESRFVREAANEDDGGRRNKRQKK